jgi:putative nucleotidyltransferase with HDIG domain
MEKNRKITLDELQVGMYVLSVFTKNKDVSIKSTGYISQVSNITKLKKLHVTHLIIDPSKTKTKDNPPQVVEEPKVNVDKKDNIRTSATSLNNEIKKAKKLYNDAKLLQHKILRDIIKDKVIDINSIEESTNAIVDSIFKNQDALSCFTKLGVKDDYLVEHSLNVSIFMAIFCKHLNIDSKITEQLTLGAFLHDIGKILIPGHILNKPGRFTPEEYECMKEHVNLGIKVLADTPNISDITMSVVNEHHERIDGKGYPNQLTDKNISQYGRMIAIVDSYDAMTAERIYKAGMHPIKAFKILISESPNSYDKDLVEKFIQSLGLYPVGTLVKLSSGRLGFISKLNPQKPLNPFVRVFYSVKHKQAIAIEELDLNKSKNHDQIEGCVKPEDFNINVLSFFKQAFL